MGKKAKKFLVVLVALVMVFAVSISLIACKDDEKEKPKKFDNTKAEQYSDEIATILANSLDGANLSNGFAMDLGLDIGTTNVSIAGNILNSAEKNANNDFRIEVKNGPDIVFGMYNKGDNLGITAGGQQFHFKNASIMKVLRLALVKYVDGFEGIGSLSDLQIPSLGNSTISGLLKDTLGPILLSLCKSGPIVEDTQASDIKLIDGKYVFKIQGDAVKDLLESELISGFIKIDTSFIPDGTVIECTLEPNGDGSMKSLAVKVNDTNVNVITNDKLFLPINEDFDAKMPENISDKEATNLLTAKVNSTVQFVSNEGNVIRDMTFELNVDMNPLVLLDGELNAETIKKLGYFTMDLKADVSKETNTPGAKQSIIGMGFYPEKTNSDSVYVYLHLSQDNNSLTSGSGNMFIGTEFNISTLLDKFLFKKPSATFIPKDYDKEDPALKAGSQLAESGLIDTTTLNMIFDLLGMVMPDVEITDDIKGYATQISESITPVREGTSSGLDINAHALLTGLGGIIAGNENILVEPIDLAGIASISIPSLLFGTGVDPNVLPDIGIIKMRTADGAATFNEPFDAPNFNPNDWLNSEVKGAINGGTGFIRKDTIQIKQESALPVEYGTPLQDYLKNSINVKFTGFDNVEYDYTFTNSDGEVVNRTLTVREVIGYDPMKVGKQDVLLHAAMHSGNVEGLLAMAEGALGMPITSYFSFIPFKLTTEVLPAAASADEVTITNDNTAWKLNDVDAEGKVKPVMATINPEVQIGNRSYKLWDNKWMFKSLPADYDLKADSIKGVAEHKFVIAVAGVEKEFTVKTWDVAQAKQYVLDIDLFESNDNTISYFADGVIKSDVLNKDNFVTAYIGSKADPTYTFELNDEGKLIISGDQYLDQTLTVEFKANVYGKDVTFQFNYTIIPNEDVADVNINSIETNVNRALDGLISLTIYQDQQIKESGLQLKNYAGMILADKDFTNFDYGFVRTRPETKWVDGITAKIEIFSEDRTTNLTAENFVNGMINTAGTYDIKITGSVGDNLPLTIDGNEEIWIDDFTVIDVESQIVSSNYDNIIKGQSLNGLGFSFYGIPIAEYPLDGKSIRFGVEKLVWDEAKGYVLKAGKYANQIPKNFMSEELYNKIDNYIKVDGVPVDIDYQNSDGEWVDFCDADGYVNFSGTLTEGQLRYTIHWGGGDSGLEELTYYAYNSDNWQDRDNITIKEGLIKLAKGADNELYVNENISPSLVYITYVAGVETINVITKEQITSASEAFNGDNYAKFTEVGEHTLTVTVGEITQDFTFNVKAADGFKIPANNAEFNIYMEFSFTEGFVIAKGTSIWDILAKSGQFSNISVNENGEVSGGVLTAEDLAREFTINVGESMIMTYVPGGFIPTPSPYLDADLKTTVSLNKDTTSGNSFVGLSLTYDNVKYSYMMKVVAPA